MSTELLKLVIIVKGLVNIEAKKIVLQQRPLVCQVEKSNVWMLGIRPNAIFNSTDVIEKFSAARLEAAAAA